jgi:hypothetical protein
MQVVYQNNIDDLVALNADLMATNEQFINRKKWNLYAAPLVLLILFSFLAYFIDKPGLYVSAVVGSIVSYLWTYFSYKNYPKKVAKKLKQKEVFCEHTVTITAEGIREATTNSESYHKWEAIDHISVTTEHIFIYNTPITAHIIPKRVIGSGDFNQISELLSIYKNS